MSSHHIIREDQEPALLIMDPNAVSMEQVQELLEWSPTVIVSEKAVDVVMSWGIKVDVVVATDNRVDELTKLLQNQFPLKIVSCNSPGETLSTALYFLMAKKQKAVNVISSEALEKFEAFAALDISVSNQALRWSFIRSGSYQKWLPAGRVVKVYPAEGESEIQTKADGLLMIERNESFWVCEL